MGKNTVNCEEERDCEEFEREIYLAGPERILPGQPRGFALGPKGRERGETRICDGWLK